MSTQSRKETPVVTRLRHSVIDSDLAAVKAVQPGDNLRRSLLDDQPAKRASDAQHFALRMEELAIRAGNIVHDLEGRTETFCAPNTPRPEVIAAKLSCGSHYFAEQGSRADTIDGALDDLQNILDRLEI